MFSRTLWSKLFIFDNFVNKLFFYEKNIPPPPGNKWSINISPVRLTAPSALVADFAICFTVPCTDGNVRKHT